jgi:hypothetical protein
MTFNPEPRAAVLQLDPNTMDYRCALCTPKSQREATTEGTLVLHYRPESMSNVTDVLALCPAHRIAVANALLSDVRSERGVIPVQVMLLINHLVQYGYDVLITSVTTRDLYFSVMCADPTTTRGIVASYANQLGVAAGLYLDADRVFGTLWVEAL